MKAIEEDNVWVKERSKFLDENVHQVLEHTDEERHILRHIIGNFSVLINRNYSKLSVKMDKLTITGNNYTGFELFICNTRS